MFNVCRAHAESRYDGMGAVSAFSEFSELIKNAANSFSSLFCIILSFTATVV